MDLLAEKNSLIYKNESYKVIGAAMEVHKQLGCGFLEAIYHEAFLIELAKQNIPFKSEVEISMVYKGITLNKKYVADIICFDKILIELKATSCLESCHEAQLINYLNITQYKLGLLINFGEESLRFKRIANTRFAR